MPVFWAYLCPSLPYFAAARLREPLHLYFFQIIKKFIFLTLKIFYNKFLKFDFFIFYKMNFNQLKKLNSAMKSFIQQNTAKKTNYRIEELKNEIEEIKQELKEVEAIENKTFDDLENIRMFNNLIKDCLQDIEEEETKLMEGVPEFRSYKTIKREYTSQLIKKYKNESQEYQKFTNEYYENRKEHLIYEDDEYDIENNIYEDGYNDFEEFKKYESQVKDLEEEFKQQAEKVVKDMEDNGEFEKYYLVASGKQEYLNKVEKLEQIKQESLKLNDILNNYSVKFDNLTIKDFETYKSIWDYLLTQKILNEPYEIKTEPLFKIKYLNKLYEVYKYKVEGSNLYNRIQCSTLEGVKKDLTNVYIKEIKDLSNIEVKPIDKIFYKSQNYEVYKFEVAESEFYKRIKAKSTISNKTRDFKNIYLKKI